jgi:hypothetical protein
MNLTGPTHAALPIGRTLPPYNTDPIGSKLRPVRYPAAAPHSHVSTVQALP